MFILYGVLIGVLIGFLAGGRTAGLANLQFRWAKVVFAGLLVQIVLFSDPVTARIGALGPPIYVLSTAAVAVAIVANWSIRGVPIVAAGAFSNLAAIVANGGFMPASPAALAALDRLPKDEYSNSAVLPNAALAPLTDIFALPAWLPFANIFSIGDVLIGVGVVMVIVAAMRARGGPVQALGAS